LTLRVVKVDAEGRRIGLSLRRVNSPDYADLDWEAAMRDLETGGAKEEAPPEADLPADDAGPEAEAA
jgi:hypothetical protein